MSKATYEVSNNKNDKKDSSFQSFICALLFFLSLCLIIFVLLHLTTKFSNKTSPSNNNKKEDVENVAKNEKIIYIKAEEDSIETLEYTQFSIPVTRTTITAVTDSQDREIFEIYEEFNAINENQYERSTETSNFQPASKTTTEQPKFLENNGTTIENSLNIETNFTQFSTETAGMTETIANSLSDVGMVVGTTEDNKEITTFSYLNNDSSQKSETTTEMDHFPTMELAFTTEEDLASPNTTDFSKLSTIPNSNSNFVESTTYSEETTTIMKSSSNISNTTSISSIISSTNSAGNSVMYEYLTNTQFSFLTTQPTTTKFYPRKTKNRKLALSNAGPQFPTKDSCTSVTCKSTASRMLNLMNHSADACVDFYEFACNSESGKNFADNTNQNEHNTNEILKKYIHKISTTNTTAAVPKFLQNLNQFYTNCVHYDDQFFYTHRMETLFTYLSQQTKNSDLILLQSIPIFNVGMDIDVETSTYTLQLTLSDDSLMQTYIPNWSIMEKVKQNCIYEEKMKMDETNLNVLYDQYKSCIKKQFTIYINESIYYLKDNSQFFFTFYNDSVFEDTTINDAFLLLDIIENHLPEKRALRRALINREYTKIPVKQLQNLFPLWNWTELFSDLTKTPINDNNPIHLYSKDEFLKVFSLIANANFTSNSLHRTFKLFTYLTLYENSVRVRENRENYCLNLCRHLMPNIVTYIYKSTHSKQHTSNEHLKLVPLFESLKNQFVTSLNQSTWMKDTSKIMLINKINNLKLSLVNVGDTIQFGDNLDFIYFNYIPTGNFQIDFFEMVKYYKKMAYNLYGKPVTESNLQSYFVNPYGILPRTFYGSDFIVIPGGIFENVPKDLPDYILKASIGYKLAKEIARKIDLSTVRLLENIEMETYQNYEIMANNTVQLLIDGSPYYFDGKMIDLYNGDLFINEIVTENTALRILVDTMNNFQNLEILPWISDQYPKTGQVFFIALAQEYCTKHDWTNFMFSTFESEHLPSSLQIRNIMSNSNTFSEEFQCSKGGIGLNSRPDEKFQFPYISDYMEYDNYSTN